MRRRSILTGAAAALVLLPAALTSLPADGATLSPPTATTGAASAIGNTGATLAATVNPNGQVTTYAFQWGPTAGYGHETPLPPGSAGSGTTAVPVAATLSGLTPGTTYHFRVIALSLGGVSTGADASFTTTGPASGPSGSAATATTTAASLVTGSSANLNGTVNPGGQATSYWFELGTTTAYGAQTAAASAGSGSTTLTVSASASALKPGTTYHYRLVAANAAGTTLGADQSFKTLPAPSASTGAPTAVTSASATLTGTVNPNGHVTSAYFQFGSSTAYGLQTVPRSVGSGTAAVAVQVPVAALQSGTTYHYRIVAVSAGGTTLGSDQKVTTATAGSKLSMFGHAAFVAPQGVGGIFVGCIGSTSCTGTMKIARSGVTLGARGRFFVRANDGGIVHFTLGSQGQRLLAQRRRLPVEVTISQTGGGTISAVVTLVPFT